MEVTSMSAINYSHKLSDIKTAYKAAQDVKQKSSLRHQKIQDISRCFSDGNCPLSFQKLIEAQHSARGLQKNMPDGQSIRVKLLWNLILGIPFTLAARVIRVAAYVLCLPLSLVVIRGKQLYYGLPAGQLKEHFWRILEEVEDLGITLLTIPLTILAFFAPTARAVCVKPLRDHLIKRNDYRTHWNEAVENHIANVERQEEERKHRIETEWTQASINPIPVNPIPAPREQPPAGEHHD